MAAESFAYRTVTCCGPTFQRVLLALRRAKTRSYYPARASLHERFGLFPGRSPLLGESLLFSSPPGTKMFQFPGFARDVRKMRTGCPIRKSAGQRLFAPYRGLSQLITSFIASVSQGIRRAPFPTFALASVNVPNHFRIKEAAGTDGAAHTFSCIA